MTRKLLTTSRSVDETPGEKFSVFSVSHVECRKLRWGRFLCEEVDVHVLGDRHLPRGEALQKRRLSAAVLSDQAVSAASGSRYKQTRKRTHTTHQHTPAAVVKRHEHASFHLEIACRYVLGLDLLSVGNAAIQTKPKTRGTYCRLPQRRAPNGQLSTSSGSRAKAAAYPGSGDTHKGPHGEQTEV